MTNPFHSRDSLEIQHRGFQEKRRGNEIRGQE
jgi:hypothetical protein